MQHYTHTLTPIEIACGVTMGLVQDTIVKVLLIDEGSKAVFPANVAPAVALSTARAVFNGVAEYVGVNKFGQPIYARTAH